MAVDVVIGSDSFDTVSKEKEWQLIPCGTNILVQIIPVEQTTDSGIVMHTDAQQKREEGGRDIGRIVAMGPLAFRTIQDCTTIEDWSPDIKIGAIVEFERYDGKATRLVEFDSSYKDIRIVPDTKIIAVIKEYKAEEKKNG